MEPPGPVIKRPLGRLNFAFLANRVRGDGGATLLAYLAYPTR